MNCNTQKIVTLALLATPFSMAFATNKSKQESKLNILFIAIDDLRPELACYGKTQLITRNINKIASQGLIFDRAVKRCFTTVVSTRKKTKTWTETLHISSTVNV